MGHASLSEVVFSHCGLTFCHGRNGNPSHGDINASQWLHWVDGQTTVTVNKSPHPVELANKPANRKDSKNSFGWWAMPDFPRKFGKSSALRRKKSPELPKTQTKQRNYGRSGEIRILLRMRSASRKLFMPQARAGLSLTSRGLVYSSVVMQCRFHRHRLTALYFYGCQPTIFGIFVVTQKFGSL